MPLKKPGHSTGITIERFNSDIYIKNLYALKYSYTFSLYCGELTLGLLAGWLHTESDTLQTGRIDLNTGLLYSSEKYYIGISCMQITRAQMAKDEGSEKKYLKRTYNLLTGHNIFLKNPFYKIEASLFFRTDLHRVEADIMAKLSYRRRFQGGLSWNINRSVGIRAEVILKRMRLGYGWDYPLASSWDIRNTVHEMYASYNFPVKSRKPIKYTKMSIRIL